MDKQKSKNYRDIYRYIFRQKQAQRLQIAEDLELSLPTVTQALNQLKGDNLIYISGNANSYAGRKANIFQCSPEAGYSIGIDLTRFHIAIVLVDLHLNIIAIDRERVTFEDTPQYYETIKSKVEILISQSGIDTGKLLGIGVSLPAIIESDQKTISYLTILRISGSIYNKISSMFDHPVLLYNDANCAGLAESWASDISGSVIYLFLSASVGGAFLNDGALYTGGTRRASEFGHMTIIPNGKECYCGRKGCLDVYCSAKNLTNFSDGNLNDFFSDLEKGNIGYRNYFDDYMNYLAIAVNNLRMCYDCNIILGGTVGAYMTNYIKEFQSKAAALNPFEHSGDYIHCCHYTTEAAAVGAAIYSIEDYVQNF